MKPTTIQPMKSISSMASVLHGRGAGRHEGADGRHHGVGVGVVGGVAGARR